MRLGLLAGALMAVGLLWVGSAGAGTGLSPAAGATTDAAPTFVVALDATDTNALVHVGTSATVDPSGTSPGEIGSCAPTLAVAGNSFACRPTVYRTTGAATLASGAYYWWLTYIAPDTSGAPSTHVSGPFPFTVVAPTRPAGVSLVSPADRATTTATPSLTFKIPAGLNVELYVSDRPDHLANGAPGGGTIKSCSYVGAAAGTYHCSLTSSDRLTPGRTYYWWLAVRSGSTVWIYGPYSFKVQPARGEFDAPKLPSSDHYLGKSVNEKRFAKAAYSLSKVIGQPKSIAVACWSTFDWRSIAGDNPESGYSILGFWDPAMPHWLELSPGICNTLETITYKRPKFANRFTANAVDTLTHEMLHALGVRNEAMTECFAMQLNWLTAQSLGVPTSYAQNLSKLSLENYSLHPPEYIDRQACREDGAWDLFKHRPSLPWHNPQL